MDSIRRTQFPLAAGHILALCVFLGTTSFAMASYNIGVGISDSTGPVAEVIFMGYANIKQKGTGLHLRQFSRAFIVDDGEERFVFVSVDSAMMGHGVRAGVLKKLQAKYGDIYTEKNVMISGTHTHSTPGGFMMDLLFDLTILGFVQDTFDALVNGITESIVNAHNSVVPGRIFVTQGEVHDANINRSPQAYLNNPESERAKYRYNVDKTMTQLQFIDANEKHLGVLNWFAVHATSMNNTNKLVSSDNVGYASILLEKAMNNGAQAGKGSFVGAFASSNLGDVSPNTRGPKCEFSGKECSATYTCSGSNEMCFASGPGRDMVESTKIIGSKLYLEALNLMKSGEATEVTGPIRVVHQYINMPEQTAEYYNETTKTVEQVKGCEPAMGYSFAAGTTDGPGSFSFEQGTTTSNPLWNTVRNFIAAPTHEDIRCHAPKPILLATGRMTLPYEWQPKVVATQVAILGNVVIAGVPGEFTTMSGRRLRESIKTVMDEASHEVASVVVAGLCNVYSDYITTPEEYQIQRYEGASTIYGPHTLTIYLKQYKELAKAAIEGKDVKSDVSPKDFSKTHLLTLVTPVLYDTPKWGHSFGDCIQQPPSIVSSGDVVTVKFISGHPRNNLMTGSTYLTVERLSDNNEWITVATDSDFETTFVWERTSVVLGSSEVTITWEVPEDVKPGQYRIRHSGYYKYILGGFYPYKGVTELFKVTTSGSSRRRRYFE